MFVERVRGHRYVGAPLRGPREARHFDPGTTSRSSTSSEFPPEFRPLAEGAVRQLLALQDAVPIAAFADFAPAGTAGIAPMQQYAMDTLTPATFMTTPSQQGVFNTQAPVNMASMGAADAGRSSSGAQSALAALQSSGRLGPQGQDPFAGFMPSASAQPPASSPPTMPSFMSAMPPVQQPASIFPGLTAESLAQAWPQASTGSVPVIGGPGPATIDPGTPLGAEAFPAPFDKTDPEFMRLQLKGREGIVLDALVRGGMAPAEAFTLVKGKNEAFGQAGNIAGIGYEQALALARGQGLTGGSASKGEKKKAAPSSTPEFDLGSASS